MLLHISIEYKLDFFITYSTTRRFRIVSGNCWAPRPTHDVLKLDAEGLVRVSFVHYNTVAEVQEFCGELDSVLDSMKADNQLIHLCKFTCYVSYEILKYNSYDSFCGCVGRIRGRDILLGFIVFVREQWKSVFHILLPPLAL
jgi:hypothetical protein